MAGLAERFRRNGLGDIVDSWVDERIDMFYVRILSVQFSKLAPWESSEDNPVVTPESTAV